MKDTKTFDVVILGAGVLGTSLAYHLSTAGVSVAVLEQEPQVAVHASGKNAGMVRQLYRNAQLSEWCRRSIQTWPDEAREHFRQTGSVIYGRSAPAHNSDLFFESRDAEHSYVYTPGDGLLDSPSYVESLRKLAAQNSARFFFKARVQCITARANSWLTTCSQGAQLESAWVVNACGAWLNRTLEDHCPDAMVHAQAYARHLFLVEGWKSASMPCKEVGFFWDETSHWYMRHWDRQTRLVSLCDQEAVSCLERYQGPRHLQESLAETLLRKVPDEARQLRIGRSWHCFRTYCEDQLPVWGVDPVYPHLFWLAAFGGFGMSTSFAATADAAGIILNPTSSERYPAFSPQRVALSRPLFVANQGKK